VRPAIVSIIFSSVNDVPVTDEKMMLTMAGLTEEGVIKLSLGRKRHVLVKPA